MKGCKVEWFDTPEEARLACDAFMKEYKGYDLKLKDLNGACIEVIDEDGFVRFMAYTRRYEVRKANGQARSNLLPKAKNGMK